MKLPFLKNKKEVLPEALKKGLLPDEKIIKRGKVHFLAAYNTSEFASIADAGAHAAKKSSFAWVFKTGVGLAAVFVVLAGTSAYADTANVPVSSPLYPLKRVAENVQLALTPSRDKAQLQAMFAARRVAEIDQLRATHPSSTLIAKLAQDAADDVSSSLSVASNTQLDAKPLATLCATFSGSLGKTLALHPELLDRFNARCGSEVSSTLAAPFTSPLEEANASSSSEGSRVQIRNAHRKGVTSSSVQFPHLPL